MLSYARYSWARLCWTDNNVRNAAEPTGPYAGSYLFAGFFQTIPGVPTRTSPKQIMALPTAKYEPPQGPHDAFMSPTHCIRCALFSPAHCVPQRVWFYRYNQDSPGGPQSIISLGSHGWMAVGVSPVGLGTQDALPLDGTPRQERQMALAINVPCRPGLTQLSIDMPATLLCARFSHCGVACARYVVRQVLPQNSNGCGSGSTADSDKCTWNHLTSLPGKSVWKYDGVTGGLGYVNAERMKRYDELLVGYATKINHANTGAMDLK